MNTILVWVLVINAYSIKSAPVISPSMADLESCQRMQKLVTNRETVCVQIKVLVPK
jgi:hypothetical protein